MSIEDRVEELRKRKEEAALGGGVRRIEAQHQKGKLTARERLNLLVGPGSFEGSMRLRERSCWPHAPC